MNLKNNICLSLCAGLFVSCSNNKEKIVEEPNFLFILVDDLGYHDLSFQGSKFYETPNVDKLASKSVVFTRGYATCQVCSPSRASILTGKYPANHGITDYIGAKTGEEWGEQGHYTSLLPPSYKMNLPEEYKTLPETLKENGYKTFFAGKWHLGDEGSYPEDHGFEINKGGYHAGGPYAGGYFSPFNNPKLEDKEEEKGMPFSMKLAKETVEFMEENQDSKFFAYLSFYAVHAPIQTTEEKWEKYREKAEQMGIIDSGFDLERRQPVRKKQDNPIYGGLVEQMDEAVGYVLNSLQELGLDKNTAVIFTSDNGGVASGDDFSTSNAPLRGGKGNQWEGGIRVPYFIHVPWIENVGMKVNVPVIGTDFYPTILDLAGIPLIPHEHKDGVSLLPVLKGKSITSRPLLWHYPHYGNQGGDPSSIIMKGNWKLIHYWENDSVELYNLKKDVGELNNLSQFNVEKTRELHQELMSWLKTTPAKYPEPDLQYNIDSAKKSHIDWINYILPKVEIQRKAYLNKDWKPDEHWWGSKVD